MWGLWTRASDVIPIFRAKLRPPPTPARYVGRSRLLHLVDELVTAPLTLVVAPAGTGKTSLLSAWASGTEMVTAWLSLDETDADAAQFWSGVVAAIVANTGESNRSTVLRLAISASITTDIMSSGCPVATSVSLTPTAAFRQGFERSPITSGPNPSANRSALEFRIVHGSMPHFPKSVSRKGSNIVPSPPPKAQVRGPKWDPPKIRLLRRVLT